VFASAVEPVSLSRRIVRSAQRLAWDQLSSEAIEEVKTGLLDFLSCAFTTHDLPWGKQAVAMASRAPGGCATVIGTPVRVAASEAAFANAVLGHGLVREDMHTGSVSHLGVVIYPVLLALAQQRKVKGRDFILAAICGYEVGAAIGRAIMDPAMVRQFRPTGITGPLGAAIAGALLYGLDEQTATSALGFAANSTGGLNEWPYSGADEMFFHAGFAARNAVTAVELAELGARASETSLDGPSGLFAGWGKAACAATVAPFSTGRLEILSVYHKPAPACNYAQTACQAALAIAVNSSDIAAITVRVPAAAINYPGCNFAGPFERILQAKMSIQYGVAVTLARRAIDESNYRLLSDAEVTRLAKLITLEVDPEFTAAYPRSQGAEVVVALRNGEPLRMRLPDVTPATTGEIRARFRAARGPKADAIETLVDRLEQLDDAGALSAALGTE
jgi:2-methylcitrate dehydratase PrpD